MIGTASPRGPAGTRDDRRHRRLPAGRATPRPTSRSPTGQADAETDGQADRDTGADARTDPRADADTDALVRRPTQPDRHERYVRGSGTPGLHGWHPMAMVRTPDRRPRLVALLLVATLLTGLAATVSAAPALPACKIADVAHQVPRLRALASVAARPDLSARRAPTRRPTCARRPMPGSTAASRPPPRDRRPQGDGERGPRGRRPRSSSSRRTAATRRRRRRSTYWVRVHGYAHGPQGERARRAQRAPARHDRRLPGIRRLGAVELHGLGDDQGRRVAEGQCLEVRLRHVVPEGQDRRHLLPVRAVALPVRRADPRARPSAAAA